MGTKRNPGLYDCHHAADPDEPIFTLRGKDPTSATIVRAWVVLREHLADKGVIERDENQVNEALSLASQLEQYARHLGKEEAIDFLRELDPLGTSDEPPLLAPEGYVKRDTLPVDDTETEE